MYKYLNTGATNNASWICNSNSPENPTTNPIIFCWCDGKSAALMLSVLLPEKQRRSSNWVFQATELALGSWYRSSLEPRSYT